MRSNSLILSEETLLHSDRSFQYTSNDLKQYVEFYNTKRITLKMGLSIPA